MAIPSCKGSMDLGRLNFGASIDIQEGERGEIFDSLNRSRVVIYFLQEAGYVSF